MAQTAELNIDRDVNLLRAMAAGDSHALELLYERFGRGILSYLVAHTGDPALAEEILQDVMLAAWQHAATFRGESKVFTWLLVIARNRAMNAMRRQEAPSVPLEEELNLLSGDTGLQERVEREDRSQSVRSVLRKLPPQYREVLVLTFFHQLTGPEIAQVLGITLNNVKTRLHRAKEAFRQMMPGELQTEGSF